MSTKYSIVIHLLFIPLLPLQPLTYLYPFRIGLFIHLEQFGHDFGVIYQLGERGREKERKRERERERKGERDREKEGEREKERERERKRELERERLKDIETARERDKILDYENYQFSNPLR